MKPENENFEAVRRLLRLKQYEQPPPRYFNDFSSHVIQRLKARQPEDRDSIWEMISWEAPLLQRLISAFETKPMLTGLAGAAVCGLLVGGAVYSERMATPSLTDVSGRLAQQSPSESGQNSLPIGNSLVSGPAFNNTNAPSIFDALQPINVQQATFHQ